MTLDVPEVAQLGFHFPVVNGQLPPEPPLGNIEYKLKLVPANDTRLQHLTSQLKWRLREGLGEAIYEIGVGDDGKLVGLSDEDMVASLATMDQMAKSIGAEILLIQEIIHNGKRIAEVMLRQTPDNPDEFVDFRISVLGAVDSGKSTTIGVLSSGELDNGRGKARLNLFQHPHEIQTGRTSSVSREMIGFSTNGQVVNYSISDTPEEIFQQSFKLITFTDLAGHQKYFRSTISGLMASKPDFVMLVISGLGDCSQNTTDYLALAAALRLPVFVVVTKADCFEPMRMAVIMKSLRSALEVAVLERNTLLPVNTEDECIGAALRMACEPIVPVFCISNVTGQNLNLLTKFLSMLPCTVVAKSRDLLMHEPAEFQISVPLIYHCVTVMSFGQIHKSLKMDGVGTVVTGLLMRGKISSGDLLAIGPTASGQYTKARIKSIQRNHAPCKVIRTGQFAAIGLVLEDERFPIRRGIVLADPASALVACYAFKAVLRILTHTTLVSVGLQGTVHCGYIRQTAVIAHVDSQDCGASENSAVVVRLKFMKQPECLRPGDQFIFRDGKLKAFGVVEAVIPLS